MFIYFDTDGDLIADDDYAVGCYPRDIAQDKPTLFRIKWVDDVGLPVLTIDEAVDERYPAANDNKIRAV